MENPDLIPVNLGFVNVYYVRGKDGGILIDTGTPGSAEQILQTLSQHDVSPSDIRCIVITHAHSDHCGGLPGVRAATGAPVLASRRAAEVLRRGDYEPVAPRGWLPRAAFGLVSLAGRISNRVRDNFAPETPPMDVDMVVDDVFDLRQFGVAGRVITTPGHTLGSLSVTLDTGDAIIGDSLMAMFGPPRPMVVESRAALGESLARILAENPARIHLSHGGAYSAEGIRRIYERSFVA